MELTKNMSYIKKIAMILVAAALLIFLSGIFVIYLEVRSTCKAAMEKFGGSCQSALIAVLEDPSVAPKEKNDAIWALGQMADPTSLPALEKIWSGKVPEGREPLDEVVSQYEIEKAMRWMKQGNITSWMYGGLK